MPMTSHPHDILRSVFGYEAFRGQQEAIIEHVIGGGDALVLMPTGGGKSLCYQIPAMVRAGVGIVVSPLIALMQDQVTALREAGVRAAFVNSSLPPHIARAVEADMIAGRYDLVYVAPERLTTPAFLELLARTKLALFAIDEAHCVSQWGHDFRPEYRQLNVLHDRFADVPRIALTATADEPTRAEILEHLGLPEAGVFISGFDRPNIRYEVVPKSNARRQLLRFIQTRHDGESGIVYCLSRRSVEATAAALGAEGIAALPYHAGLDARMRHEHQDRFLKRDGLIIVATIAFGMGIDKPDVRFVAHLDLPKSLEAYYQETGRAGRDGLPSDAWMCYGYGDAVFIRQMVERSEAPPQRKRIEHIKLGALLGYCETAECRRAVLLRYFGEEHPGGCGNCDTCSNPVHTYDGTIIAQKALSNVYRTGQYFGAAYLADVLVGADDQRIMHNGHQRLSTFGIGTELDRKGWMGVYRQLVAAGVLDVEPQHGGLRLSRRAWPVLKGQQTMRLRRDPAPMRSKRPARSSDRSRSVDQVLESPADRELFEALRHKRLALAQERNVPPYVIFHDRTLIEMALEKPSSLEAMARISGVGNSKLATYGEAFLRVIEEGS
jgi:ATP-dependent DNA helicase RecQ